MTAALALLLLGLGVALIWSGVTGQSLVAEVRAGLGLS